MKTETKSACGAASLVAAVLGVEADSLKRRLGLPTLEDAREYREYQKLIKVRGSPLWGKKLTLACFQCGETFERSTLEVIYRINKKGSQLNFCNRHCMGAYSGTHYGFVAHPENAGQTRGYRKWNRRTIWALYLLTGYGSRILSRLLGIPRSTVCKYLQELRARIGE